jgi:predicted secreted protein
MKRNVLGVVLAGLAVAAVVVAIAVASATPVGPLPNGPTTTIAARIGHSFTVRLPKPKVAGRVWRIARPFDSQVVRETREGETAKDIWVTFRAVSGGSTKVVFALTKGETRHAYAAHTYKVVVSPK